MAVVAVFIVTGVVAWLNRKAFIRIEPLEKLLMEWAPVLAPVVFLIGIGLVVREIAAHDDKHKK